MKKIIGFVTFFALFLLFSPVHAGHDFMKEMKQAATLTKKESCSNGKTTIEHMTILFWNRNLSVVFVTLGPDNDSKNSQFYTEENKDFYSTIFYKIFVSQDKKNAEYFIKYFQSGDLEKVSDGRWYARLVGADSNAFKSLVGQPGSDCKVVNQ